MCSNRSEDPKESNEDASRLCGFCKKTLKKPMQSPCSGLRFCKDCAENVQNGYEANTCCPFCKKADSSEMHEIYPDRAAEKELLTSTILSPAQSCGSRGQNYKALEGNLERHIEQNAAEHMDQLQKRERTLEVAVGITPASSVTAPINKSVNERLTSAEERIRSLEERLKASNAALTSAKGSAVAARPGARSGTGVGGTQAHGTEIVPVGEATGGPTMQSQSASIPLSLIVEKMPIYEGVITVLNREVEKLTTQLEAMERQRRQEKEQLDTKARKVNSLDRTVALKDVTISELDLRITALEQTSYDGILTWKITDFSRRRQEAISGRMTSIYSPAFYTSKTGYKMCARLYLNGDGMGRGSHVSLFFVIMRGEYDALLKWPFRQKVTLMFLDQSGKDQHVMDAFHPDPTSSSFKRPTTEMNIASRCTLFMPLTQLDNPLQAFVKDDTGFMKISVSLSNLS